MGSATLSVLVPPAAIVACTAKWPALAASERLDSLSVAILIVELSDGLLWLHQQSRW